MAAFNGVNHLAMATGDMDKHGFGGKGLVRAVRQEEVFPWTNR